MPGAAAATTTKRHKIRNRNVGRGNACRECRDSKIRCDGVRPVCGRCMGARKRSVDAMRRRGAVEADVHAVAFVPCFETEAAPQASTSSSSPSSSSTFPSKRRRRHRQERLYAYDDDDDDEERGGRIALPAYDRLKEAIEVSFRCYRAMYLFHPGRLIERIALPVDDERYPHPAALHAILALAYAAEPALLDDSTPHSGGTHYRHFLAAQRHIRCAFRFKTPIEVRNAFDVARASLLLVVKAYGQGGEMDTFLCSAQSVRICVALNLHRDDDADGVNDTPMAMPMLDIANRSKLRPVPADAIEAEEMRRAMLFAFSVDRTSASATLWPWTLSEEEYTSELPRASFAEFERTTTANLGTQQWPLRTSPNAMHASAFVVRPARDAGHFIVKCIALYGRCAQFVSRLAQRATAEQVMRNDLFQQLQSWLTVLQLESKDVVRQGASTDQAESPLAKLAELLASILPHMCTLTLHEPIANLHEESAAYCRAATREIISHLRHCVQVAQDVLQLLDIPLTLCIAVAGRSLIRQLERIYVTFIMQQIGDGGGDKATTAAEVNSPVTSDLTLSVSHVQADLQVVLLILKRMSEKWPIADQLHASLLALLDFHPENRFRGIFFAGLLSSSSSSPPL